MKSIQISNLRCLSETGEIEMKPLMLLVGANSSGKSSFLRVFPLFRQSIETRKRGPLLWFGSEVDFGSFGTTVTRGKDRMSFMIKYDETKNNKREKGYAFLYDDIHLNWLRFEITSEENHDRVSNLAFQFFDDQMIVVSFNSKDAIVTINGREFTSDHSFSIVPFTARGILPIVIVRSKKEKQSAREMLKAKIVALLKEKGIKTAEKSDLIEKLLYVGIDSRQIQLDRISSVLGVNKDDSIVELLSLINDYILFSHIDDILESINMLLTADFGNVSYIKPLRASAERYYRVQNLSVDALASDGHNMAMYLNELYTNPEMKRNFQQWTRDNFSFFVETEEGNGHVSIKIQDEKNGGLDNIADMGSGYAQLLPIIITLWQTVSAPTNDYLFRFDRPLHRIIAIEQPELHLHPMLQARLAEVLSSLIKKSNNVSFIIETHSKEIINRIGINVEERSLKPEDISILLFDDNHQVRLAHFNSDGVLQNWPMGFFDR